MKKITDVEVISLARELRHPEHGGLGLRQVAQEVEKILGVKVSHEWVRTVTKDIPHPQRHDGRWSTNPKLRQAHLEKRYRKLNPDVTRQKQREYQRKRRRDALDMLGGECVRCGFDDWRGLQIDHVEGGGHREYKELGNQTVYARIADGNTEGYQLLCANCNMIKRYEREEHN